MYLLFLKHFQFHLLVVMMEFLRKKVLVLYYRVLNEGALKLGTAVWPDLLPHLVDEEIRGSFLHLFVSALELRDAFVALSLTALFFE